MARKQSTSKRKFQRPAASRSSSAASNVAPVKSEPSGGRSASTITFARLLRPLITAPDRPLAVVNLYNSPLAHLQYPVELATKNKALALFWLHFKLPGQPEEIMASPKARHYRTTSKRKTVLRGSTLHLLFNDRALSLQKKPFVESPLETREHGRIFAFLQKKLSETAFRLVAGHLNYLIIRGNYKEHCLIFNLDILNGPIVRKLKIISDHLQKFSQKVTATYIYPAASGSEYYLDEHQPANTLSFKKIFGRPDLAVFHHERRYLYHPTSFSQVNESMVAPMLTAARQMLNPADAKETLLDLYCGYGLFSHFLASDYKQVLGIDLEGPSIRSALNNKRLNPTSKNCRFLARRIDEKTIDAIPPALKSPEAIVLDPPRQGPYEGVIAALIRRQAAKVLHIHCGVDEIPNSIKQWQQGGYEVERIVPLDMFPGSANLEVLILFGRGSN